MTWFPAPLPLPAAVLLGLAAGFALGLFHFASLRRVTALYLAGRGGRALALQLGRLGALAGGLALLALAGAVPLLSGAAGVLAGRAVVLARARREASWETR